MRFRLVGAGDRWVGKGFPLGLMDRSKVYAPPLFAICRGFSRATGSGRAKMKMMWQCYAECAECQRSSAAIVCCFSGMQGFGSVCAPVLGMLLPVNALQCDDNRRTSPPLRILARAGHVVCKDC